MPAIKRIGGGIRGEGRVGNKDKEQEFADLQIGLLPYTKKWFTSDSTPGCPLDYCSVYRRFFWLVTWALNRPEPLGEFLRGGKGYMPLHRPVCQEQYARSCCQLMRASSHWILKIALGFGPQGQRRGFIVGTRTLGGKKRPYCTFFGFFSPNLIIFFGEQQGNISYLI